MKAEIYKILVIQLKIAILNLSHLQDTFWKINIFPKKTSENSGIYFHFYKGLYYLT